jgi:protein-tyrosine kinase
MSRIHEALKKAEQEKALRLLLHRLQGDEAQKVSQQAERESNGQVPQVDSLIDLAGSGADAQVPVSASSRVVEAAVKDTRTSQADPALRFEDLAKRCTRREWNSESDFRFSLQGDNGRVAAEGFRTLRSRLYQIADTRSLRRILVTSSFPGEGKTFVVSNLAKSIVGQPERRVLLIDADLRAPRLHAALGAPSTPGLTDYLRGQSDEYAVVQRSLASNLYLISCGENISNPSELLLSDRLKKLLDRVTPLFDWVILDSPPTLLVHDASSLAHVCDGVLFVVKAGATSDESAKKGSLEFRNKNLLGVVLNQMERSEMQESYYGYSPRKQ